MTEGCIEVESSGRIRIIRINRPEKRNALSARMCADIGAALRAYKASDDRVAILCAEGPAFSAGGDLTAPPAEFWRSLPDVSVETGKPLIAAVQGPVVGLGLAFVLFCDLCVAADDTRFIYPEARVGVAGGLMGALSVRMPHKIAMEVMLLGQPLLAARAYEVGFVNRVVPRDAVMSTALDMAQLLVPAAPLVIELLKQSVNGTLPRAPVEAMFRTRMMMAITPDSLPDR